MASTGIFSAKTPSPSRAFLGIAVTGGIFFSLFFLPAPLSAQAGRGQGRQGIGIPNPTPFPQPPSRPSRTKTEKQKEALAKYSFRQMKKHADELAELAQSLQKKIGESNENVLSLDVVRKAEKIEKLAKKIKNEAKGY